MLWLELNTNYLLAFFTFLLAVFTGLLVYVARKQNATIRTIERAYVNMSHCPPGVDIEPASGRYALRLQIKNFGRTPATVTDVFVTYKILPSNEDLPETPDYKDWRGRPIPNAFLVTEDQFFHRLLSIIRPLEDIPLIESRMKMLCFYGYVDYIDAFHKRHRAGYARVYVPHGDSIQLGERNNLVFIDKVGYNYDRERKKGEGKDWN